MKEKMQLVAPKALTHDAKLEKICAIKMGSERKFQA
jgi:hypothetical protein